MTLFRSLRATALTIGLIGLGTAACQPGDRAAPQSASSEHSAEPFSEEEARAHAAWQTDVVFADGDFGKGGWGGQFLHVSPSRDLVVAWFGTFGDDFVDPDLQSVARQLATR